jgi:hypothetical protein
MSATQPLMTPASRVVVVSASGRRAARWYDQAPPKAAACVLVTGAGGVTL